jgi:hypothetical protein
MLLSRDGRALYPHNDLIRRINTAFSSRLSLDQTEDPRGRFTIPTWALIGAEDYWVDALSADIGIPEQQKLTIRTGHGGVKAPTDRSDESYTYVRDCLEITLKPRASLESEEEEISVEDASISNVAAIRTIATSFFGEEVTPVGAHPITHNLSTTGIRSTASLEGNGKRSDLQHAFPDGFGTGVTIVFTAEKPTEARDQAHHRIQGWWGLGRWTAVGDDPGGLPLLGIEHHVTRQIRAIPPQVTRCRIRQAMIR